MTIIEATSKAISFFSMIKDTPATKQTKHCASPKASYSASDRPYNCYNLFFILERELFLQSRGVHTLKDQVDSIQVNNYSNLDLPNLPPRYQSLILPDYWFVHGRKKNQTRPHIKTHGVASLREIAVMVASNWKTADEETLRYVKTVANVLKRRRDQIKRTREAFSFAFSSCGFCQVIADSPISSWGFCQVIPDSPISSTPQPSQTWNTSNFLRNTVEEERCSRSCSPASSEHRIFDHMGCKHPVAEVDLNDAEIMSLWYK